MGASRDYGVSVNDEADSVSASIYKDDENTGIELVCAAENGWYDKYPKDFQKYLPDDGYYTIEDLKVNGQNVDSSGYTLRIERDETDYRTYTSILFTIRYTKIEETETCSVTARVIWKLDDGGTMPDSVDIVLYRAITDSPKLYDTQTLSAANGWRYTWNDLRTRYTWTVGVEEEVPGFVIDEIRQQGDQFSIIFDDIADPEEGPDEPDEPDVPDTP